MSILWLILKILLGIVGLLFAILVLVIGLVFILPIDYLIEAEKYDDLVVHSKVRIFYLLNIIYKLEKNKNSFNLTILGKYINKRPIKAKKVEETAKSVSTSLIKTGEKVVKDTTKPFPSERTQEEVMTKSAPKKENPNPELEKNIAMDNLGSSSLETKEEISKSKLDSVKELWDDGMILWKSRYRRTFIRAIKRLVIQLIRAMKPKRLQFKVIVGRDNPADTGELLAKVSLLYPFYSQYGVVEGEFEKKGIWGQVKTSGRLRLYQLLKPVLVFLINKSVRNYIKIIMNLRKEEKNGI